ncbi:MAG: leucine-rich repeat domain-containing protein [Clostridiales bacterium]|nr:leucine-rich repeat domain-containing protein [Clostridiales bacterium]
MVDDNLTEEIITEDNAIIQDGVVVKYVAHNLVGVRKKIIIPDEILGIDFSAFEGRGEIESVVIGKNVQSIACSAFSGCINLRELIVSSDNPHLYSDGNCIIRRDNKRMIIGCKASVIPADGSVTTVWSAFHACTGLTEIAIPEGVERLNALAFYGCENLREASLPSTLKFVGHEAYAGCKSLKKIIFNGSAERFLTIADDNQCIPKRAVIQCLDGNFFGAEG